MVQDLRAVNKAVKLHGKGIDAFELPRVRDIFDALHGADWFSAVDAASGYFMVRLDPESRPITAFQTK